MNTEKELELLKAENVQLKRDQEFLFLVLDISLGVVEQWAKDNGLLAAASEIPIRILPTGTIRSEYLLSRLENWIKMPLLTGWSDCWMPGIHPAVSETAV